MQQLRTIQSLRAIAAIAVMFAHLYGVEARHSDGVLILGSAWLVGVSGVDLFFVISGFIMVWVAGDVAPGANAMAKFYVARIARIYPLWWFFAGLMAIYLFITYGVPWDADKLAAANVGGWEHVVKSFLLVPHEAFPILPLGWTLIHEIYFYLVFGLLLLLPRSMRLPALILWALVIMAGVSAGLTGFYADGYISLALYPMTLEFLMGAAVAKMIQAGWTGWRWPALALGLVWLIAAQNFVDFESTDRLLPTERTFAFGPAFALLIYALVSFERTTRAGRWVPELLVRIGDWSYALYLGHLLVISAVGRVYFAVFATPSWLDNLGFVVIASAASLVVAGLTYHGFERPLLKLSRVAREKLF